MINASVISPGLEVQRQGQAIALQATGRDPNLLLPPLRCQISLLGLRVRLIEPAAEMLQIFWIDRDGQHFSEERSVRVPPRGKR